MEDVELQYQEVLQKIHMRHTFSSPDSDLRYMRRVMELLGNPQEQYRTVHIAGTNGKGSTAAMSDSILRAAGYRVGLFTSPYLVDFRERIQIDRKNISKQLLIRASGKVCQAEDAITAEDPDFVGLNEFEFVTAVGFLAFALEDVDYAVIEVGLGGRRDPTNILTKPAVTCIMPISFDHTGILGNTLLEIAGEKAGIIKDNVPLVIGRQETEVLDLFRETAAKFNAPVSELTKCKDIHLGQQGSTMQYRGNRVTIPLLGSYQIDNAASAYEIGLALGISDAQIIEGIANTQWQGRLQLVRRDGKADILIDAGHNEAGITGLINAILKLFPNKNPVFIIGMMRDKDYEKCIQIVCSIASNLIATRVNMPRALEQNVITACVEANHCRACAADDLEDAILLADQLDSPDKLIVVCGSVYLAGEAVGMLTKNTEES